jgi:hypothetical protein
VVVGGLLNLLWKIVAWWVGGRWEISDDDPCCRVVLACRRIVGNDPNACLFLIRILDGTILFLDSTKLYLSGKTLVE